MCGPKRTKDRGRICSLGGVLIRTAIERLSWCWGVLGRFWLYCCRVSFLPLIFYFNFNYFGPAAALLLPNIADYRRFYRRSKFCPKLAKPSGDIGHLEDVFGTF